MRRPASNAGPTAPDGVAEFHRPGALGELLPRADFVILTVPHTPTTVGFFDRKPAAFFINIGRGMTTKLDDLVSGPGGGRDRRCGGRQSTSCSKGLLRLGSRESMVERVV